MPDYESVILEESNIEDIARRTGRAVEAIADLYFNSARDGKVAIFKLQKEE